MNTKPLSSPELPDLDLDHLEALCAAAPRMWYGTLQIADGVTDDAAVMLIEACNPDTVAELIALARRPPVPAQRPTDDELWDSTLRDRDNNQEWADKLAGAIAIHFGVDIGEHSNANCPWHEALEAIESAEPARRAQPEGVSTALREVTDKLSAAAAENLSLNMSNIDLRDQLARVTGIRPEGEAPQAAPLNGRITGAHACFSEAMPPGSLTSIGHAHVYKALQAAIAHYVAHQPESGAQAAIGYITDDAVAMLKSGRGSPVSVTMHSTGPWHVPIYLAAQSQGAQALDAVRGKLDAVWQGVRDAVAKYSGKPCEGEPFDRLDELLAGLAAKAEAPALEATPAAWEVGLEVFRWLSQAQANVRDPGIKPSPLYRAQQAAAPAALDELAALRRLIECAEILDKRPRPMCRDCADEDGTCPNSGLECDMRALLAKSKALYNRLAAPSAPGTPEAPQTAAARDVLAERQRQVEVEGRTPAHDDQYAQGQMAQAAACYASQGDLHFPENWPWSLTWWKPAGARRNLVKAGALILAEIERLDRAAQLDGGQGEGKAHG